MSMFDTTGAESCRRCGENARAEVERLQAENEKLRELAQDAMKSACVGCPHKRAWRSCEGCNLYERATKLGVEVES